MYLVLFPLAVRIINTIHAWFASYRTRDLGHNRVSVKIGLVSHLAVVGIGLGGRDFRLDVVPMG